MKKKILCTFMVMSLSLSLLGCGGEAEPANDSKVSSESVSGEKSDDVISNDSESNIDVQPEVEVKDDVKEDSDETSDAGFVDSDQSEVIEPEETESEVVEPEETESEVVEPEETESEVVEPEETESEVVEPEETESEDVESEVIESEPEEELSLDELRVEKFTYDFEGVYWLTEYGSVKYFDGTYAYSYDDAGNEDKQEYAATDRTYEYVGAGYGFVWYMYENNFCFWLDGGEMGGDSGAMEMTYTPISKEKAMELCPAIK